MVAGSCSHRGSVRQALPGAAWVPRWDSHRMALQAIQMAAVSLSSCILLIHRSSSHAHPLRATPFSVARHPSSPSQVRCACGQYTCL